MSGAARRWRAWLLCALVHTPTTWALDAQPLEQAIRQVEADLHARIGMAVIDTSDDSRWSYHGDERFPLNSTHKAFTCAALLRQVDRQQTDLTQTVTIAPASLVAYSPITEQHLAPQTMTLQELCAAAVSSSDNTAANEVTAAIGGPLALTAFMRTLGDSVTQLDRTEPELNAADPQDERDTTTPHAATTSLQRVLLGSALSAPSRALLQDWMLGDRVADGLLRAGLPKSWPVADKSGAGGHGSRSIVAVVWPTGQAPVVAALYMTQTTASMAERDAAIARLGTALAIALRR